MNRRVFFERLTQGILAVVGTLTAAEAAAMVAHTSQQPLEKAAVAGSPAIYAVGSLTYIEAAQAWLGRDALGFYAIDAHCTHLGCLVKKSATGFDCPCHGSKFDSQGNVTHKPAQKNLRFLLVSLDSTGSLSIDRTQQADPIQRVIA